MSMLDKWNKAWERDGDILSLTTTPKHFKQQGLEGRTEKDRNLIRRAIGIGIIHTQAKYDELGKIVCSWGYAIEVPINFEFSS